MANYERQDGTRCVLVKPGDVLIISGVSPSNVDRAGLARFKAELNLRNVIVIEQDAEIDVRDVDAELAKQKEALDTYHFMFQQQNALTEKLQNDLDEANRKLSALTVVKSAIDFYEEHRPSDQ